MAEKILEGLYRIEVPLPQNPLKMLNAYFIKTDKRNLLIDNGFNRIECREAVFSALQELNPNNTATDYFITHGHADHAGLTPDLPGVVEGTSRIMASEPDAIITNRTAAGPEIWASVLEYMRPHGIREEDLTAMQTNHPASRYCPSRVLDYEYLAEGDSLSYGDFDLQIIDVRGHTPGHLALYAPKQRIFFAGDHILDDITPNITYWNGFDDALGQYLQNLDKVRTMDITLTLPGHRSLIPDTVGRIDYLKEHHQRRLAEVMQILEDGSQDAFAVAARMRWNIRSSKGWEDFPAPQKWFAGGEALAHLKHLEALGKVVSLEEDYTLPSGKQDMHIVFKKLGRPV